MEALNMQEDLSYIDNTCISPSGFYIGMTVSRLAAFLIAYTVHT